MDKLSQMRKMSTTELSKLKKDELITVIKESDVSVTQRDELIVCELRAIRENQNQTCDQLKQLNDNMRSLREDYEKLKTSEAELKKEVKTLSEHVKLQGTLLKQQQAYLEKLDMRERGRNLVMTGIPEGTFMGEEDDKGKVSKIMAIVGEDMAADFNVRRMGPRSADKVRPLMITLMSMDIRNKVVSAAKECSDPSLTDIRIKKDTHPAVRQEWKRLFEVKQTEQEKPENAGRTILVDMKKRQVICDNEVIDTWNPSFF